MFLLPSKEKDMPPTWFLPKPFENISFKITNDDEGGLLETVVHAKTGWLTSPDPSPDELIQAIKEMNPKQALSMRDTCEKRAIIFCTESFMEKMRKVIG